MRRYRDLFRRDFRYLRKAIFLCAAAGLTISVGGCATVPSVFNPASISARATTELILIVFGISAVIFVLVEGLLFYTFYRFRQSKQPAAGIPAQVEGNRRLEILWTTIPILILIVIFYFSLRALLIISNPPKPITDPYDSRVIQVTVVGKQWFWEFQYPDYKVVTASELHIPVDKPVRIELESADVIHSFWVPELSGKIDVIPGKTNVIWIQTDKIGEYEGQCAEFCGTEHAEMRFSVIAESADQFDAWMKHQQTPAPTVFKGDLAVGADMFINGKCANCHTIDGTTAQGTLGPNLTHFASRKTFAGGSYPNTTENVRAWLEDPQAFKPGNLMPNLHLTEREVQIYETFVLSLK